MLRNITDRPYHIPDKESRKYARYISKAVNRTEIPEDIVLWRGAINPGVIDSGILNLDIGAADPVMYVDKGFTSTSLVKEGAQHFLPMGSTDAQGNPVSILLEIHAPQGTKACAPTNISMTSFSYASREKEVILDKDVRMKLINIEKITEGDKRYYHVMVEVIQ